MWDVLTEQWEIGLQHLREYAVREGHCRVHQYYKTSDGYRLGNWVSNQRVNKDTLTHERIERLEAVAGWAWGSLSERWEQGFRCLTEFVQREGHCRVAKNYKTPEGYPLGMWMQAQRTVTNNFSAERKKRLEAVPGWVWDVRSDRWETSFNHLAEYTEREGHCRVPKIYRTSDGFRLGLWVSNQRVAKDSMPAERKERLEGVIGWAWRIRGGEDD